MADDDRERDFPAERISIQYLSGNHDRLANATPRIRRRIRELLGLDGDAQFAHLTTFPDPAVLIRHGQEYDRNNFCEDLGQHFGVRQSIPLELPEDFYSGASFGDFITIDVAVRLPYLFRREYGDAEILRDRVLAALYLRLLQFDDVRPQSALLDYLLDTSGGQFSAEDAWERLVPVLQELLSEIHDNRFLRYWLARRAKPWAPAELEAARALLKIGPWRNRLSREVSRRLGHFFLGGDDDRPELFAMREQVITSGEMKLVIAGHTHVPAVELIASDEKADRFYINSGTWRNRIPATPDRRTFGRIKALTYVMLLSAEEDTAGQSGAFDYWTGYTRHWSELGAEEDQ